jgi:RluA family pseudouridine synthase
VVREWLQAELDRPLTKAAVRRLLMAGAVRMGGRPARAPGRILGPGLDLEARVDTSRLDVPAGGRDRAFVLTPASILYEDDTLIAVDKPPGLPTVPTADPRRPSLVRAVDDYLSRAGRPRRLGVHQRLDRDTSGVVLFARDPAANAGLAKAFAARAVEKVYEALVARPPGRPPARWQAVSTLGPVGGGRMGSVHAKGQEAVTDFALLEELPQALRVEARPRTGRKHQIRVQLAEAGLPILGDVLYGPRSGAPRASLAAPRLMLHARRLRLTHPLTGTPLAIESPWPADAREFLEDLRMRARPGQGPAPHPGRSGG